MFGGTLNHNTLALLPRLDLLLAAYSSTIYVFSISEGSLLHQLNNSSSIVHLSTSTHSDSSLISLSSAGELHHFRISQQCQIEQLWRVNISKNKMQIIDCCIDQSLDDEKDVFWIDHKHKLHTFNSKNNQRHKVMAEETYDRIMYSNQQYLVVRVDSQTKRLQIIEKQTLTVWGQYEHATEITAVEVQGHDLILGDQKGKIHIIRSYMKKELLSYSQVLEWHTHSISCLKVHQNYLYSTAQEGVIVMWHLRENNRDFLPRIGGRVNSMFIQESVIYCFMADNSIKSINLSNDKSLLNYKIIVNPHSFESSLLKQSSNLLCSNLKGSALYLRAQAGCLQRIDLFSGFNESIPIISRNLISGLDEDCPQPHEITHFAMNKDESILVAAVQGAHEFSELKFYQQNVSSSSLNNASSQAYTLISKVQNPHSGCQQINLISVDNNTFISYSKGDVNINVWNLTRRQKQSIMQVEESYFYCSSVITYRNKTPLHVSLASDSQSILITYSDQFILLNLTNKRIDHTFQKQINDHHSYQRVFLICKEKQNKSKSILVQTDRDVFSAELINNSIQNKTVIHTFLNKQNIHTIKISPNANQVAIIQQKQQASIAVLYDFSTKKTNTFEIQSDEGCHIEDSCWVSERYLLMDSSCRLYDMLNQGNQFLIEKLNQKNRSQPMEKNAKGMISEDETNVQMNFNEDYSSLSKRYLERREKKEKIKIEQCLETIAVTPSLQSSFKFMAESFLI